MHPLLLLSDLVPRQLALSLGKSFLATSGEVAFSPIFINMVSGGGLVMGREFRLGALTFVADDSAWLQEAPSMSRLSRSVVRCTSARAPAASSFGSR